MSMSVPDSTVHRGESLDQKVDLLIERMSECVRFVREYMQPKLEQQARNLWEVARAMK